MWVTAYTDASFKEGRGTWAIWLRSGEGRIVRSGTCPDWVDNNTAAEMYAAYQAVMASQAAWPTTVGVFVHTDCQTTAAYMWPWSAKSRRDSIRRVQELLVHEQQANGIRIRARKVKGHQQGNRTQAYLNRQVDELAGRKNDRQ